ncbi:thiamine pyrophosphate-binding protein [Micromonospora sp. KC207]|uniref:thiamine pyrophosphate-binding protein n=1 Tax=Micromonospora sp. KC207 TaxID=2530377 RepID=UPI001045EAED|nr:thiamine pyrophosphate-binding protein [Micromonospora sp. KC207]TDC49304.1 thiamine pyrophosphate-binding protein [Micromonospora sp. KC207]
MTPLEALFAVLREEGVTRIFGNPGTTELPLLDALAERPEFEYTLGLQEASVMAMADGYARATGRTGFVNLHVAAGLANGLVGMLNAARSRTPLVVTAGQQDRRHLVQDPMLAGDLVGIARPVAKHAFDVQHAHDLPLLLRRAFALAARPPAGPVFLSLPMDLMAEATDVWLPARSVVAPPGAAPGLAEAARLLEAAQAPVVVAGDGVGREGAVPALVAVAERLGATVYHQPMNDGVDFPGGHPLHAGTLPATHAAIRAALTGHDIVFIVGCHAFTPHHYTPEHPLPDGIRVVQLDSDAAEIGRNFAADRGLVGGIRVSLEALAELLDPPAAGSARRTAEAARRSAARRARADQQFRDRRGPAPIDPYAAAYAVATGLPDDAVLVEEAITTGVLLRRVLRLDRPGSYVHTVGGGLGSGIGAAVGHRLGDPRRPVVAVLGDGCTMFGLQGLWSAVRYRVPVTFVVMNNGEYRTLKDTLDGIGGPSSRQGRYLGLDLGPPALDFTRAAAFFGMGAIRVRDTTELTEAVAKAGTRDAPLLIDVPITGHRQPEETA